MKTSGILSLVHLGGGGAKAKLRDKEKMRVSDPSMTTEGKPCSLKIEMSLYGKPHLVSRFGESRG